MGNFFNNLFFSLPQVDNTISSIKNPSKLPLSKIKLDNLKPSQIPYCFIFYNGTFCPFHKGH